MGKRISDKRMAYLIAYMDFRIKFYEGSEMSIDDTALMLLLQSKFKDLHKTAATAIRQLMGGD